MKGRVKVNVEKENLIGHKLTKPVLPLKKVPVTEQVFSYSNFQIKSWFHTTVTSPLKFLRLLLSYYPTRRLPVPPSPFATPLHPLSIPPKQARIFFCRRFC